MIEFYYYTNLAEKQKLVRRYLSNKNSYIVSDLRSKLELQNHILSNYPIIENDNVLRANELWQKLLKKTSFEYKIVSKDLMESICQDFLDASEQDWLKRPGTAKLALDYLDAFLATLAEPNAYELLRQWFFAEAELSNNRSAFERWGVWYILCEKIWKYLQNKQLILSQWASAILLNQDLQNLKWNKTLVFDLGLELKSVEAQFIKNLSEHISVIVFVPKPIWSEDFKDSLLVYQILDSSLKFIDQKNDKDSWPNFNTQHLELRRYSSSLAEIKSLCYEIRKLCEQGNSLDLICIASPNLKHYWPVLSMYLEQEQIVFNKSIGFSLNSYSDINLFISRLRLLSEKWSKTDLELCVFDEEYPSRMSYEKFEYLFKNIYDAKDLHRDPIAEKYFKTNIKKEQKLNVKEFLDIAIAYWPNNASIKHLQDLVSTMLFECNEDLQFNFSQFLDYLSKICGKKEVIKQEAMSGLQIVDLASIENVEAEHLFLIGICDQNLRDQTKIAIHIGDSQKIYQDTGLIVNSSASNKLEYYLRQALDVERKKTYVFFPSFDLEANIMSPCLSYLLLNDKLQKDIEHIHSCEFSTWDKLQALSLQNLQVYRNWSNRFTNDLEYRMQVDANLLVEQNWNHSKMRSQFSASSIEKYLDCPYKFAAEYLLKEKDRPSVDIDIDPMTRGSFVHALFARIYQNKELSYTDQELFQIIEDLKEKYFSFIEPGYWNRIKAHYLSLAKDFIHYENQLRRELPSLECLVHEEKFQVYFDFEKQSFSIEPTSSPTCVKFIGSLDRIDVDQYNNALIVDYKSSAQSNYSSWIKDRSIQFIIYILVYESYLKNKFHKNLIGAFFHNFKSMERKQGILKKDIVNELHKVHSTRAGYLITDEDYNILLDEARKLLSDSFKSMQMSYYPAIPHDQKNCKNCSWRFQCRAPHLN